MNIDADFYIGKGKEAEWLGSVSSNGDINTIARSSFGQQFLECHTPELFKHFVSNYLHQYRNSVLASQCWPWLWGDSGTTDRSYWFFDDKIWCAVPILFNGKWKSEVPHYYISINEMYPERDSIIDYNSWVSTNREQVEFPIMGKDLRFDKIDEPHSSETENDKLRTPDGYLFDVWMPGKHIQFTSVSDDETQVWPLDNVVKWSCRKLYFDPKEEVITHLGKCPIEKSRLTPEEMETRVQARLLKVLTRFDQKL